MASVLLLATSLIAVSCTYIPSKPTTNSTHITIPKSPPANAGVPLQPFVSFSIEFSSFPDYAGNLSHPNNFSNNLLDNLAEYTKLKPLIRVGGNTADLAIFNQSLDTAIVGIVDPAKSPDYPTTITIGPAFFESYLTWPDTHFIHGFNLGENSTTARQALIDSVPFACKALGDGRLAYWELGNEPDLFNRDSIRPPGWNESDYAQEWLTWSRKIRGAMQKSCPDLAVNDKYKYIAPSFAGTGNLGMDPILAWGAGLDTDRDIALISSHNYISGANVAGVTLQNTLMNHSSTVASVAKQLNSSHLISALPSTPKIPFILGESNSLYQQGRPGLSNTFGAALWGVDFNLWSVANHIKRIHMHQGTNYRYQAWQAVDTNITTKGTKAPYYGNVAVAAFLGDLSSEDTLPAIVNLPLPREKEAAYASYVKGKLARVIVVNMDEFNATAGNEFVDGYERPVEKYSLKLPKGTEGRFGMRRLLANGSDAVTGVTFDGFSYNYELDGGLPVKQTNVTSGETVDVGRDGMLEIDVPWSSAVIVDFEG
jgi:hypothetical protein